MLVMLPVPTAVARTGEDTTALWLATSSGIRRGKREALWYRAKNIPTWLLGLFREEKVLGGSEMEAFC
jgi:hypothetical protein